ncbi:MAG: hypothetical protein JKY66_00600 [Spongiibacteraceae bacterium]|nr:hypothetical protein [Spongiibacteraceae bacterium]
MPIPDTVAEIKQRISRYKSAMKKEQKEHGYINDGMGKRYILFYLYLALNNTEKSLEYCQWFEQEFFDDIGEPAQLLCWTIILYRAQQNEKAKHKLAELMLSNLYIIPHLLKHPTRQHKIWHGTNQSLPDYINEFPEKVLSALTQEELNWIESLFESLPFKQLQQDYIRLSAKLNVTDNIEERKRILTFMENLNAGL